MEKQNHEDFLEAAIAWAEGSQFGIGLGIPVDNLWRQFAEFLMLGNVYE